MPVLGSTATKSSPDVLSYSRWPEIMRSWFWRFYDHLFHLILYNFGWAFCCFGSGWLLVHFGLVEISQQLDIGRFIRLYSLYLVESAISVGWAFWVFKVFIEGAGTVLDIWIGIRNYFWKAIGVSAISGALIFLTAYNLYFYFSLTHLNRFLTLILMAFTVWILFFLLAVYMYQWPVLFFQNPPFLKIFYKSFLLAAGNGLLSMGVLFFFAVCLTFFIIVPFLLFFISLVFIFSFQCVMLEKSLLRYKITYGDKPLTPFLEYLDTERQRGWRDIFRPWGTR